MTATFLPLLEPDGASAEPRGFGIGVFGLVQRLAIGNTTGGFAVAAYGGYGHAQW